MKKLAILSAAVLACAGLLWAGVDLHINVNLGEPDIVFEERPAVVLAAPGIYVIPDYPEEVFFVGGFYWVVRGDRWYRSAGPRSRWVLVERRHVPSKIIRVPRGKYKHWHPAKVHKEEHAEVLVGDKGTKVVVQEHSSGGVIVQEHKSKKKHDHDDHDKKYKH